MSRRSLYFSGDRSVIVEAGPVPEPGPGEVLVSATCSAISPGTELLVYRGEVTENIETDSTIDALEGSLSYPLQYGYATAGEVTAVGSDVYPDWEGRRVFAFHPHESHFLAAPADLVPTTLPPETATLLANMEAAVSFVMDARPRVGERVAVFGQGPVGLLTTAVLASCPLDRLVTVDYHDRRRRLSEAFGADDALAPDADVAGALGGDGADHAIELSGDPDALDAAIDATGYAGQVVVGSWYGTKPATLDLGGEYHRSHIRVRSSQVSRVDPDHAGRWDKDRRLSLAADRLGTLDVAALITHRVPIEDAGEAYRLLDRDDERAVQALLTYDA